jgi:tetratricopeptide (TPR) repeat protein
LKKIKQNKKTVHKANKEKLKTPLWFYLVLFAIPIISLILLELGLRVFDYGYDLSQWIKASETKYVLNPEYTRRYFFTTNEVPYSNGNVFDIDKKENTFRIFILGGSSAAGYPFTPNGDFGRYLKKYLESISPQNKIEVVNLAITAVNSYTLLDLTPGILEQKPDLIIIYAGHNEYYGALGVGSMESLGTNRSIVKLILKLNNFRTTQLVRNFLKWAGGLFTSKEKKVSGTLMSRMAKDQLIELNSDIYEKGIDQFQNNLNDILKMTKASGVPVILSTLTCNLKDQQPFISVKDKKFPEAGTVYKNAEDALDKKELKKADSLFRFAKDLDALRFRAPEILSQIIYSFGKEYHYPVVNIDSVFEANSPEGITGSNLMTDHLHPTLSGYKLMAKSFFETMAKDKLLPIGPKVFVINLDAKVDSKFYFTSLDSTIGKYRIIILKNDWPFTATKSRDHILSQLNMKNGLDTLAMEVIEGITPWEKAHREMAELYLKKGKTDLYAEEMLTLIDQFPVIESYYKPTAEELLKRKNYAKAYEVLKKKYEYSPDAFSTKWLGIIDLSNKNTNEAIKFLNESIYFDGKDAQVLFNLAGAYSLQNKFNEALESINKCLAIDSEFPGAKNLRQELSAVTNRK